VARCFSAKNLLKTTLDPLGVEVENNPLHGPRGDIMSEPTPQPASLPLTIKGRSPFDERRLQWQGTGSILLALYCMLGVGGAGGIIFGILFLLLALATWIITRFGFRDWYSIPTGQRIIAGTGSVIGLAILYLAFGVFFLTIWFILLICDWMS
jgi:hypothetical protein